MFKKLIAFVPAYVLFGLSWAVDYIDPYPERTDGFFFNWSVRLLTACLMLQEWSGLERPLDIDPYQDMHEFQDRM